MLDLPQPPSVRYSHSKCRICPYIDYCRPDFEALEDISLLWHPYKAADHLAEFESIQFLNLQLVQQNLPDVPYLKGHKRKHRAFCGQFYLNDIFSLTSTIPEGTWIHFDIEDNPLTSTVNVTYIFGISYLLIRKIVLITCGLMTNIMILTAG